MNPARARIAGSRPRRRGAVLVVFALLTFVFFAVAGIAIDVGLASLTQAQMQAAVDSAAIEGCRWRNFDEGLGFSHAEKRRRAASIVRLQFDDDLNPTRGGHYPDGSTVATGPDDADASNLGAGPTWRVRDGSGSWNANAVVDEHEAADLAAIDDPWLQPNFANQRHGDLVVGRHDPSQPPVEAGSYERDDFTPAAPGSAERLNALSFLVRMRRAGDGNPQDVQPNVSSSLPTVPFVFGLGSTMLRAPGEDWDPRRDGLTVRATAIASARPAMRVGRTPCDENGAQIPDHEPLPPGTTSGGEPIRGVTPFYLTYAAWTGHFRVPGLGWQATLQPTSLGRVRVEADGRLVLESSSQEVGRFVLGATSDPCAYEPGWPDSVGRRVTPVPAAPVRGFRYTTRKPAYIPIVESIPDVNGVLVPRVVGYGFAHLWPTGTTLPDASTPPFDGTAGSSFIISAGELILFGSAECWVAQDNASAVLTSSSITSEGTPLSAGEWEAILAWSNLLAYGTATPDPARVHDYTYIQRGTVLAPALTR